MKTHYTNYSSIRLKDKRYIKIYFKNHKFTTGYSIDNYSTDWDENKKSLTSTWIKKNKQAYTSIESLQIKINKLIDNARAKGENELQYLILKIKEQKENSKKIKIAQTQLPSKAFEVYISIIQKRGLLKPNSFKRFEGYLKKLRWYEETNKCTLSEVDYDYILNFAKCVLAPKIIIPSIRYIGN